MTVFDDVAGAMGSLIGGDAATGGWILGLVVVVGLFVILLIAGGKDGGLAGLGVGLGFAGLSRWWPIWSLVFVLVLLLYSEPSNPIPGRGDVTATVSPWDSLSDTLQTGIAFPTFNNPFATGVLYTSLYANATEGTYGNAFGCDNTTFWECLLTDDGNLSYLAISGSYIQFVFNVSEMPSGLEVPTVIITLSCRSTTAQRFRVFLDSFVTDDTYSFSCETGTDFVYTSFALNCVFPSGCRWFSDNLTKVPVYILTWPDGSSPVGQTDFTFIKLDIYSTAQPACAGNPFENTGCQIARKSVCPT